MQLSRNSVWLSAGSDLMPDNLYRILELILDIDTLILFPLKNTSSTARPIAVTISNFKQQVRSKSVRKAEYPLPNHLLVAEDKIPIEHIVRRDKKYALIEGLVKDSTFIFDYATKKRIPQLALHAGKVGSDRKTLARILSAYWLFGQNRMALLPAYINSGGTGKEKKATTLPLGAPKQVRTLAIEKADKYIVTDADKVAFRKVLKKYHFKPSGVTLAKAYRILLSENYSEELRFAEASSRVPHIPSEKQFRYWSKQLFSKLERIKSRATENDYLRNKRGTIASVIHDSNTPGTHFEIDATVADVHIISQLGSQNILGRPTIYIVADRASRMIVGMHVSLYHASWRAARQALANCFLPKSEYCKEFGIEISDYEWPCHHAPQELVCDNGEMIGTKPKESLNPLTKLVFTPPYRPDCKGVVEKRFDILNKSVLHDLLGTTKGGAVVRGSRDPRKDAVFTLREVTAELIKAVLEHNNSLLKDLAYSTPLLVENDLSPTPLNYWKIHVERHKHSLVSVASNDVIAQILPPSEGSVTQYGVHYNGLYYTCSEVEKLSLTSIARASGQWRVELRIDENTTNYIYARLDKVFVRCELTKRSRLFRDKSMIESDFMQDWFESKKEHSPINVSSIDNHIHQKKVIKNAVKRSKESSKKPFSEKTKNVRRNRNNELEQTTNIILPAPKNGQDTPLDLSARNSSSESQVETRVISLPQGKARRRGRIS